MLINRAIYYYRANDASFSSRYEEIEEEIASCDRLLRAKWIPEDVRQALRGRRNGLRRHRPWKALHRKRFAKAVCGFVACPGSLLHGISLARLELAKRAFKRSEGPASS